MKVFLIKNNYSIDPNFNFNKESLKVVLLSQDYGPGKTCLNFRIIDNYNLKDYHSTTSFCYSILEFEINNYISQIYIWDTNSRENVKSFTFHFMRDAEIVLYLIDLTKLEGLDEYFIEKIKSEFSKDILIYLVANKIDLIKDNNYEYFDNLIQFREKAKSLIENKKINYYFEVSAKNSKGINYLIKNIKWYILRDKKYHRINIYNSNKLGKYINM